VSCRHALQTMLLRRVLDAGARQPSPPSTLVDCTGSAPRLVREGAISVGRLKAIVPSLVS